MVPVGVRGAGHRHCHPKRAPDVAEGLKAAARFLHAQHIFDTRFLPHGSQLIPMAAVFALPRQQARPICEPTSSRRS
ncbi:hypothetical protein AB0L41_00530 [Amycolatopsis mediterranei]|uniref:hypothetical protein n=1 Tax=Amycolatopsis mediterranei TaxID=33910 RepID=UPI00343AD65B